MHTDAKWAIFRGGKNFMRFRIEIGPGYIIITIRMILQCIILYISHSIKHKRPYLAGW